MDQKELDEKIKEYFLRLPPELQKIVGGGEWIDRITEIGKANGLNIVQEGQLQQEVMLVMLGIIHPDKFLWDIKDSIGLPKEKIDTLIKESSEKIFIPVRQQLIDVYTKNAEEDEEESEPETPAESASEKSILEKSGISLETDKPATTPSVGVTEDRKDMLAGIENPPKSQARVLNEVLPKQVGAVIPVPRAPYAGNAQSDNSMRDIIKQVPLAAKPAAGILADKLGGVSASTVKATDHSIGSMSTGGDAYREPIE